MHILSRKPGEELVLDENITVIIVSVHGNKVRLGVMAQKEILVKPQAVYDRKLDEAELRELARVE